MRLEGALRALSPDASRGLDTLLLKGQTGVAIERPNGTSGWRTVAIAAFGLAFGPSAIFILSFGILIPVLQGAFGWSPADITVGSSIASLTIVVVSPMQGWLVDRFGARRVILCSLPSWAVIVMAFALLPNDIGIFYLLCGLVPLAALGLWPLSFLQLPTTWFDRHLGLAIGLTNVGIGVGVFVVPLYLGYGFSHWGWRMTYAVLGLFILAVVLPVCIRGLRSGPLSAGTGAGVAAVGLTVRDALKSHYFSIIAASFFLLGIGVTGLLIHQVSILIKAGFSPSDAIYIQSALGMGAIVGRIGVGWLLDRMDVRLVSAGVFATAMIACLVLAFPGTLAAALLGATIIGMVIGAEFDVLVILIRRYVGLRAFGRIYGLVFGIFQLGSALGGAGMGMIVARTGSYTPGLIAFGVLLAIGAVLISLVGPPRYMPVDA